METFAQATAVCPGVKVTLAKAKAGEPEAQYNLARWVAKGTCCNARSISSNRAIAISQCTSTSHNAARQWLHRPQYRQYNNSAVLAGSYNFEVKLDEAARLYQMAASNGHAPAMYQLAKCYASKRGVERDYNAAVKWLEAALAAEHPKAAFQLGKVLIDRCTERGDSKVRQPYISAISWCAQLINNIGMASMMQHGA